MDTPFKWVKQVPSHFGGTSQGMAISWPGHIGDPGGIRRQFHHVIDIVPTILEATGIPAPDTINGIKQLLIEGTSLAYTWDKANANAPTRHTTQYFEMLGNRAVYHDGWVAATTRVTIPWELSTKPPPDVITGYKWELYNIQEDPTQSNNDLAAKMPEKLKQFLQKFETHSNQRKDVFTDPDSFNQTTPSEIGMLLSDIYQCATTGGGALIATFPDKITSEACKQTITLLSSDKIGVLIEAGVPEGTPVAHKHGWIRDPASDIMHNISDARIVYTPGGNYVLVIYLSSCANSMGSGLPALRAAVPGGLQLL